MNDKLKPIAVFGAGGFGLEVAMLIEQINEVAEAWQLIGFFDDGVPKGDIVNGYTVLGGIEELNRWDDELFLTLAIGNPKVKTRILNEIKNEKISYPTLIHPSAILGDPKYVEIGEGSVICAGNIITTNISIGRHVILNLACTVGHEVGIGDYSSFMPTCNISGGVIIGEKNYWGTGAKVINHIKIGNYVTIGAGAVVIEDLSDGVTAVGVPAKPIKK